MTISYDTKMSWFYLCFNQSLVDGPFYFHETKPLAKNCMAEKAQGNSRKLNIRK